MAFPSTFADLQTTVVGNLRMDSTVDAQKIKDAINQAYYDACVKTEANTSTTTLTMVSGTSSYTLASTIARIKGMYSTPAGSTQTSQPLRRLTLDQIIQLRMAGGGVAGVTTGAVYVYALVGLSQLEVYPTPRAADVLTIYQVAFPTALSSGTDVPILPEPYATDILVYGACEQMGQFKKDPDTAYYGQLHMQAVRDLQAHISRKGGQITGQFTVRDGYQPIVHDPSTDIR